MGADIWTEAMYRCDRDKHAHDRIRPCADSVRAVHEEAIAEWKRRAAKHGCNVDDGDPDCG